MIGTVRTFKSPGISFIYVEAAAKAHLRLCLTLSLILIVSANLTGAIGSLFGSRISVIFHKYLLWRGISPSAEGERQMPQQARPRARKASSDALRAQPLRLKKDGDGEGANSASSASRAMHQSEDPRLRPPNVIHCTLRLNVLPFRRRKNVLLFSAREMYYFAPSA